MNLPDEEQLFADYGNGRLQPEAQESLKRLLRDDPAARLRFGEFLEETAVFIQVASELSTPEDECIPPIMPARPLLRRPAVWFMTAAAAAIAAIAVLALQRRAIEPQSGLNDSTTVADGTSTLEKRSSVLITSVVAARFDGAMDAWLEGDDRQLVAGTWLTTEAPLNLAAGVINMTLESGVAVTIEGPATFHVESADRLHLQHGRVYAEVPPGLAGFVVTSPSGTVVDLGTRFGYEVRRDGSASLHVFEGIVEFWPPDNDSAMLERLRAGEAVAIDARGHTSPENFASERFIRVPDQRSESRFVKWSCDSDDTGYLYGFGQPVDLVPTGTPPLAVAGKYDGAIRFVDDTAPLTAAWRPITGSSARTLACWIRLPPADSMNRSSAALVSWGDVAADSAWQLAWNVDPSRGTVGALASSTGKSQLTANTDLRDGSWHHVAAVVIGSSESNLATHVRHYVDGRLESVSYADSRIIDTAASPVMVGLASPTSKAAQRSSIEIDELIILHDALSGLEVKELMREGPPPTGIR